ncbi:MAG: sigma-54 dependent transcriptional regulator [Thermodesulfovibrionales bacterium]|jgi:DNA-binding NtrC family response regulator|nr:sigma-54 dependent transcriptional regulator [Thermodesulfovibrionales bacterium]
MSNHNYKPYLIIVDDEPHFSESLQMAIEDTFKVSTAPSLGSARELLKEKIPDAVLLDMKLPDGNGIDFLRELKVINPMPVVIIMTAYAAIDNAVTALKEGAVDYFTKPLDIEKLKRELNVYLENKFLQKRVIILDREIKKIIPPFVTSGAGKMKEIVDKVPLIASLNIPVLIKGETGTGKEKLAEWIHAISGTTREMVAINCSALPRDIFESEFFGHMKGAFSGAVAYKEGLIERAEDSTLFLDEIGEIPEAVQAKFLRVLEDGVYYKVGDSKERKIRFRLISATNKDLADPANNFRPDLFYRINGITFELPPLRERREDIPLLITTFIKEANNTYNKNVEGVSTKVKEYLMNYTWPGNIRELKWLIHRAVAITSKNLINIDDLSISSEVFKDIPAVTDIDYSIPFQEAQERLEKKYIKNALSTANNNKTEAARILGISVRVLHYKIKKYRL